MALASTRPLPTAPRRWRSWGGAALVLAVLGGVFALYRQPAFLVMMIDQLWACF